MIKTFVRFCDFLFRCLSDYLKRFSAEREGFEPPEPRSSTVFKTAAIDHSAISPLVVEVTPHASLVVLVEPLLRVQSYY